MTDFVRVVDITRECQYVNERWERCGRLADTIIDVLVGNPEHLYRSFRCPNHKGMTDFHSKSGPVSFPYNMVAKGYHSTLGYKP